MPAPPPGGHAPWRRRVGAGGGVTSYPPVTSSPVEPFCASPAPDHAGPPTVTNQTPAISVTSQTGGTDPELDDLRADLDDLAARLAALTARLNTIEHATQDVLDEHPQLRDSTRVGARVGNRYMYSKSLLSVLYYLFHLVDADEADRFFDQLGNQSSPEGSPVWHLQLALLKRLQTDKHRRLHERHYVALTIKAWNAYASGAPIQVLRHRASDPLPAIFDPYGALEKVLPKQDDGR